MKLGKKKKARGSGQLAVGGRGGKTRMRPRAVVAFATRSVIAPKVGVAAAESFSIVFGDVTVDGAMGALATAMSRLIRKGVIFASSVHQVRPQMCKLFAAMEIAGLMHVSGVVEAHAAGGMVSVDVWLRGTDADGIERSAKLDVGLIEGVVVVEERGGKIAAALSSLRQAEGHQRSSASAGGGA